MTEGKDANDELHPDSWMVRPCVIYQDEYSDCTSFRGRFQQYFVHGVTEDCTPWKRDYENCLRWKENKNKKAFDEVVASENIRRAARLKPHYENSVWESRSQPPPDWNAPLPDWMEERNKGSYLSLRAQEMKEGKNPDERRSYCVIS